MKTQVTFTRRLVCFSVLAVAACFAHAQYSLTVIDNTAHGSAAFGSDYGVQVGVARSAPFPATTASYALMWTGSAASQISLQPAGYGDSIATGAGGGAQIGYAYQGQAHAILWHGSAASFVDLQPAGYSSSFGNSTDGTQQVGEGYLGSSLRAMLWSGSAGSFVDLTPIGMQASAKGVDGGVQVGYASSSSSIFPQHAYQWGGSAATAEDINPTGYNFSQANAVKNGMIVGYGGPDSTPHALVWTSSGTTDLNSTMEWDYAWGTNGVQQVGYGYLNNTRHALVWSGSAGSQVDLNQFIPSGATGAGASSIDRNGVVAGWIEYGDYYQAAVWNPVPEPGTLVLLGGLAVGLFGRRRRGKFFLSLD